MSLNDVEAASERPQALSRPSLITTKLYHDDVFPRPMNTAPVSALVCRVTLVRETAMKSLLIALGLLTAASVFCAPALAQNYPWCEFIGDSGGGKNCGFVSFEQCMQTARGNGSDCRRNTTYTPPPGPHPHPVHRQNY
jgi:hypothetical protein